MPERHGTGRQTGRLRHAWLYALPGGRMPEEVECGGARFRHVETFKHDFFAATGLYRGASGLVVLKMGRTVDFMGLPIRALSRWLMRREVAHYQLMAGSPGVPVLIGIAGETGFLHAFVPGRPLGRDDQVGDEFFDELFALLRDMHGRGMAYVDLNKRQNVLVGEDGRPYLIDFQISLYVSPGAGRRIAPLRWILGRFQQADLYHALKHKRRIRPDLLTAEESASLERLSVWIRLHRTFFRPLTQVRRRILAWIRRTETGDVAGSSAK